MLCAFAQPGLNGLFLGLGAVALFVGAVGIANVMVISVLERRPEIGLRRALGATRRHIASQFITESLLLGLLGGVAGVLLGILATTGYALAGNLPTTIPASGVFGGLAAALLTGAIAGLYPAVRAAQRPPRRSEQSDRRRGGRGRLSGARVFDAGVLGRARLHWGGWAWGAIEQASAERLGDPEDSER